MSSPKRLQGNCSNAPPESMLRRLSRAETSGAPAKELINLGPAQCLLISYEDLMPVDGPSVWIDNLYLRVAVPVPLASNNTTRRTTHISLVSAPLLAEVPYYPTDEVAVRYITRCTFQGDGLGPSVGVEVSEDTYLERAPPDLSSSQNWYTRNQIVVKSSMSVACARLGSE